MWVWLKLKLTPKGDVCVVSVGAFLSSSLCTVLSDTWMGKYSDFPSQTPLVRTKSAIYTPKRDDEHPRHLFMGVPQGMYHDSIIRDNAASVIRNSARGMNYGIQVPLLSNPESSSWTPKSTALNSESNQHCLKLLNTRKRLRQLPIKWRK